MGRSTKRYRKEEVIKAINKSNGIVSRIAARLGCDWHTADKLIKKWPDTIKAMQDETETMIDVAEGKLYESIVNGDTASIKWYLSKKAKHRGYGEESLEEKVAEIVDTQLHIINDLEPAAEAGPAEEGGTNGA